MAVPDAPVCPTGMVGLDPSETVRVVETDQGLAGIGAGDFVFGGRRSPLAIAFVSPHLDFAAVVADLQRLAGEVPLLAMSTAGELCSAGSPGPLYKPTGSQWSSVVVQVFSPELLAAVSIHSVPLHNRDIRAGMPALARDQRVERIVESLADVTPGFRLNVEDSFALTFVDGLSFCENYLMEAVYRTGRFPCLFVGGSAGGRLDFTNTYLFDGRQVLENHAVIAFLKLAEGKRYGVLKSQNFRRTGTSFVVVDADPDRRVVASVLDPASGDVVNFVDALSRAVGAAPDAVAERLNGHTFGIDLNGELFIRSISRIDLPSGQVSFFCDVEQGDELHLLQATDFADQTRRDVEAFLRGKPPPLAALLNDCILRRLNNTAALGDLDGLWRIPVAGFSTFGELLGININQTLTAIVLFDDRNGDFKDDFLDAFPVHYASFCSYFTRRQLNRIEILNRLRSDITHRLIVNAGLNHSLAEKIERMMGPASDVVATMENVRATISGELAREKRARQAERRLANAIEAIGERFALYDEDDRLVVCNSRYRDVFEGSEEFIRPGLTFSEITRAVAARGIYGYDSDALERFLADRAARHARADGSAFLQKLANDSWVVSREYRMLDGGVVTTHTDVTELKRREEQIESLKQQYRCILDSAADGIIGIDTTGVVTFVNQAACRMLGVAAEAIEGTDHRQALGAMTPGESSRDPFRSEAGETYEAVFARPDGSRFTAEYVLAPIQEEDGLHGAVLVFRDISLRKRYETGLAEYQKRLEEQVAERTRKLSAEVDIRSRAELALRESQGRLLAITGGLFEGVLLVDRSGVIVFANRSAHRWLETESLVDTELDRVLRLQVGGRIADFSASPFRLVIESGKTVIDDDAVFVTGAGRRVAVAYATSPLEEADRRRVAIISFRSIDALKEAQREALQSSRLASVGQLAAGIAHEINTPIQYVGDNLAYIGRSLEKLIPIVASAHELAGDGSLAGPASERLRAAIGNTKVGALLREVPTAVAESLDGVAQIARIVLSMKEFSHPGTNAKTMTDINRALDSTLTVSRNVWKKVAAVDKDFDPALPPILCHPGEMNQVYLNLIVNAAQAIEVSGKAYPGRITVSTRLEGGYVSIRIADSGTGVPPALREKIFDPFFTTKDVGKGTGQGLAICRDVVMIKHGGTLTVDGKEGEGAIFTIRLPADGGFEDQESNE